jgi:hypothetical protein
MDLGHACPALAAPIPFGPVLRGAGNLRIQGASADQRQQLGSRRPASVSFHVGAVLPRCKCNRVRLVRMCSEAVAYRPRFIVDSADKEALPVAREELNLLLEKPALEGIPLLVLGNKSDLPNKLSVDELIEALNLKAVTHREVSCYGISAKEETNLDAVLQWLIARASK